MQSEHDGGLVRSHFPIFQRRIHQENPLIYLDSAATSQKPNQVIQAISDFYEKSNANIHRGIHELAEEATALYEQARKKLANFIGVQNAREIIFTRNTTEAINLVARSWGEHFLQVNDIILLTEMEHHSNLVPWYMLAEKKGLKIEFIPIREDGLLDLEIYQNLLEREPKLVSITHMSNVLGTINPAKDMCESAHQAGALVMIDGAQSVPHFSVDMGEIGADFYAFSAHKMCGPTGIGALYTRLSLLNEMPPFLGGGDMIRKVTFEGFSANELPYKFEAGTPAIAEGIGFGAAVDFLDQVGMNKISEHERRLSGYALEVIGAIKGIKILGPSADKRGGVVSFTIEGIHPHDVAQLLDRAGIAVRAGHHCAMPLHQKLNLSASTRASFYLYNTLEEIDALEKGLETVKKVFL